MSCPKNVKSAIADIEPPFEPLVSIAILFKSSASRSSGVLGVIASEVRLMIDKERRLEQEKESCLVGWSSVPWQKVNLSQSGRLKKKSGKVERILVRCFRFCYIVEEV